MMIIKTLCVLALVGGCEGVWGAPWNLSANIVPYAANGGVSGCRRVRTWKNYWATYGGVQFQCPTALGCETLCTHHNVRNARCATPGGAMNKCRP